MSKLTPRVIAIVLPLCNVDAPPVVILAFAADVAPPSTAQQGSGETKAHVAAAVNASAVARHQERSRGRETEEEDDEEGGDDNDPDPASKMNDRVTSTFVEDTGAVWCLEGTIFGLVEKHCTSWVVIPMTAEKKSRLLVENLMVG